MTNEFFTSLEARGFGWLIDPAPVNQKQKVSDRSSEPFTYFTYEIRPESSTPVLFDNTWASLPIDGVWGFMKSSGITAVGPCMLHLCENADGVPVRPSPALARHWCPVLFDDQLLNE